MKTLAKNVVNLFGQEGNEWLDKLPTIIKILSTLWSLTDIKPVTYMNWNYVAKARQYQNIPVVLKISCDKQLILDEYKALKHFDGHGAIQVIDRNTEYNALLLKQAIPGELLKDMSRREHHPKAITDTINIYASVVKELATRPLTHKNNYTHVSKWLEAIDQITDPRIEKPYIDKAQQLRSMMLNSAKHEYLCHGDLHLENIISNGSKWLAIDPKGIVGEMAFEAAAFDLIDVKEIKENQNIPSLIIDRITLLSKALELNFDRLLSWVFLRIIMSAQWFVEDNGDPSHMLTLASYYPLLNRTLIK